MKRLIVNLNGTVQGVGFRPFVYRIATDLELKGYVLNDSHGVTVEVEGDKDKLDTFLFRLNNETPPLATIYYQDVNYADPVNYDRFFIKESKEEGKKEVMILPDITTCNDCLNELFDPDNRRYRYPFINCTNCGPRYTIIEKLPYDRPNTTMRKFPMCPDCKKEYEDPLNRRFHAQPNACPVCGPHISIYRNDGSLVAIKENAMAIILDEIRNGNIAAVKGIGGFHLICDARNDKSVQLLRELKKRQEKPFAVMFKDLAQIREYADTTTIEESSLTSPSRPIVLIKSKGALAKSVAPGLQTIGAFLPYTPLHAIILNELNFPIIATSGNFSDEPIVKDNEEAFEKLAGFTHYILTHNRDINVRCDDSVIKIIDGYPSPVRRARGYAPLPVKLPFKLKQKVLAVGGFLKNTFAIGFDDKVILSQHIGDVETLEAIEYFEEAVNTLSSFYDFEPEVIIHDLHPRYETTRWALGRQNVPKIAVQHHYAHILSCMAENSITDKVLGVSWDGTGYGEDGTLWGGEFLICDYHGYERKAYFKPFKLIGGEKAIKEPRRVALSLLFDIFGKSAYDLNLPLFNTFKDDELNIMFNAWQQGINAPYSSSAGRLFDGVASIINLKQKINYEGQAAMLLEEMADLSVKDYYPYTLNEAQINWNSIICSIMEDTETEKIPSRFINTLSKIILDISQNTGIEKVCLSGGVFQNNILTSRTCEYLKEAGFKVYIHQKVPSNDGGISLGQAVFQSVM